MAESTASSSASVRTETHLNGANLEEVEAGAAQHPQEGAVQPAAPIYSPVNETSLHRAVWRRAPRAEFQHLFSHHERFLANIDGMPPLYLAVHLGYTDTVENLIETFGKHLSCDGPNGQTVLHIAALRSTDLTQKVLGWREKVPEIRSRLEINKRDTDENTCLHYAASVGVKGVTSLLVAADANMKNMTDKKGMYPIHIAASVGAMDAIRSLFFSDDNCSSADLLDDNGGTFLHVAVKNSKTNVVKFVCRDKRFRKSFLEKERLFRDFLNTKDVYGNTALHLAVQNRDESNFSHLVGNRHVELNHVNKDGYTPLDLARKIKTQSYFASLQLQNPTEWMIRVLAHSGAQFSAHRRDWRLKTPENAQEQPSQVTEGSSRAPQSAEQERPPATQSVVPETTQKEQADLDRSTDSVLVASALIATVTFAAAFTVPGSYKLDGNPKAGTPALGTSYGFKVFLVADVLAFFCSVAATFSLAAYGTQWNVDPLVRRKYAASAVWFFHLALKSVIVAFALGVSVVMWDISVATTIIVGFAALLLVIYGNEALAHDLRLIEVMWRRFGLSRSWNLHPSTSSQLYWDTWRHRKFFITVVLNVIDLCWTYIVIYIVALIAQLKLKAGHPHL